MLAQYKYNDRSFLQWVRWECALLQLQKSVLVMMHVICVTAEISIIRIDLGYVEEVKGAGRGWFVTVNIWVIPLGLKYMDTPVHFWNSLGNINRLTSDKLVWTTSSLCISLISKPDNSLNPFKSIRNICWRSCPTIVNYTKLKHSSPKPEPLPLPFLNFKRTWEEKGQYISNIFSIL